MRGFDAQRGRLSAAVLAVATLAFCGCPKRDAAPVAERELEMSCAVAVHAAYCILAEKPDAKSAFLTGAAASLAGVFERAGLSVSTNGAAGKFDIVATSLPGPCFASEALSESGVFAEIVDVRKMRMADLKKILEGFPSPSPHLWMPGEGAWLVAGCGSPKLDDFMDLFAREEAFEDLAVAALSSPADVFADFAGTAESAIGAFRDDEADEEVRPEYFLTRDIPVIDWLAFDSVDGDIAAKVRERMRTVQVIRRLVVEGAMLGLKGDEEGAVDAWSRAALRNPGDSFLCERLVTLEKNAALFMKIGNVKGAARCYETLVTVRPDSAANLRGYAASMLKLGETNVAERAFTLANTMERKVEDGEGRH